MRSCRLVGRWGYESARAVTAKKGLKQINTYSVLVHEGHANAVLSEGNNSLYHQPLIVKERYSHT